jgi:hypothetical protein
MRPKFLFSLLLIFFTISTSQAQYILPNETVIFSFLTSKGKTVTLNKDKEDKYLVYRFGTKDHIEFQFPEKPGSDSWQQFEYSFLFRGGGIPNDGMDVNYIAFINGGYKYVLYQTYFAVERKASTGIKIINVTTEKTTDIKAAAKTIKGSLVDFRTNEMIGTSGELYD